MTCKKLKRRVSIALDQLDINIRKSLYLFHEGIIRTINHIGVGQGCVVYPISFSLHSEKDFSTALHRVQAETENVSLE